MGAHVVLAASLKHAKKVSLPVLLLRLLILVV